MIPTASGRVRKLRVSYRTAGLLLLLLGCLSALFTYTAVNFGELHIARSYAQTVISRLEGERESLSQQNVALRGEVESLRRANARVLAYEETIKRRLQVLSTTIESATSLGLFDSDEHSAHGGFGSLGGAEVECMGHVGCAASLLRGEQISQSALGALVTRDVLEKQGQELVAALDFYSDLLSAIPIGTPGNGHISSPYGMRRSPFTRRWTMHQGIDISLPYSSHVHSTAAGYVKRVKRTSTYGLLIDIAHNDRVVTRYAHLSKALVRPGEEVCRGEVLGLAGSSGRSTGPHLHYEVRIDSKPQNPAALLALAKRLRPGLFQFAID